MNAARRILATAFVLAAVAIAPLAAETAPRRLVVAVEAKGDDEYSATELLQLSRSLMAAIESADADILLLDWGPEPFPVDKAENAAEAVKRTADCWIVVTIAGSRRNPALAIRSYDILKQQNVIEGRLQLEDAFEFPEPSALAWEKLVGMVAEAYPALDTDQPVKPATADRPAIWTKDLAVLTLHAAPGTVVEGLDGGPRTLGEDGVLKEPVRSPATYVLSATHPGSFPLRTAVYLENDREVALEQLPLPRWSVDAGLYGMSFPQVEGSFFLVPGWLYVRAGLMTYLGGLAFNDDDVFWSAGLSTFAVRLGTYAFLPPESPVRFYAGAGAILRLMHVPSFFGLDPLAPFGVQLTLGVEASPWPRSRFFLEWLPTEYVAPYPDLFAASMPYVPDSMVLLPFAVFDLGGFRLGWRWMR